jgi:flagellar L-ring protein precursor FlgH
MLTNNAVISGTISIVLCLLLIPSTAGSRSLWNSEGPGGDRSNFSSHVAVNEGDILLIEIAESTQATSDSNREREKAMETGGEAGAGADGSTFVNRIAQYIPIFGVTLTGASNYESEREADASGTLNTQMSVVVDSVRPNGLLELKGEQKIKVDDEIKELKFEGLARAQDVSPNNTIPSNRVANAEIYYESELGLRNGEPDTIVGKTWKFFKNVVFY